MLGKNSHAVAPLGIADDTRAAVVLVGFGQVPTEDKPPSIQSEEPANLRSMPQSNQADDSLSDALAFGHFLNCAAVKDDLRVTQHNTRFPRRAGGSRPEYMMSSDVPKQETIRLEQAVERLDEKLGSLCEWMERTEANLADFQLRWQVCSENISAQMSMVEQELASDEGPSPQLRIF